MKIQKLGHDTLEGKHELATIPQEAIWLENYVSPKTRATYKKAVQNFITFHGIKSPQELRAVDQAHLITWRNQMIEGGAAPKTITQRLSALSSLFKFLCDKQEVDRNPVTGVRRPRVNVDRVATPVVTPEQVRKMLDAPDTKTLKGVRDSCIFHIFFYTGCRVAEITKLKVKDYYEDAGYHVLDFIIKGGTRNRVPIHPELKRSLDVYLEKTGHGDELNSPLVLTVQRSHLRRHLNPQTVSNVFHEYADKVGLPRGVSPHSCRATFITQALESGCPLEAVQKTVAHKNISTTQMYDKRVLNYRESASFAVRY